MADATKRHADECRTCDGVGYTRATATEYAVIPKTGEYQTTARGSGCPDCGGTGRKSRAHS